LEALRKGVFVSASLHNFCGASDFFSTAVDNIAAFDPKTKLSSNAKFAFYDFRHIAEEFQNTM